MGKEGGIHTHASQIEDYQYRGHKLEEYSYIRFVIDTYEERVPLTKTQLQTGTLEISTTSVTISTPRRGPRPHPCSSYLTPHPCAKTYCQVIRPEGHNMLPDIVGLYLPSPKNPYRRNLYYASMLALLILWWKIEDLNANQGSWEIKYNEFILNAMQQEKDIIAGIEFYYECHKTVMKKAEEHQREEVQEKQKERECEEEIEGDPLDESMDVYEDEEILPLTEVELGLFKLDQRNQREEQHGAKAIFIAQLRNIFGNHPSSTDTNLEQTNQTSGKVSYANGDNEARLQLWQKAMEDCVHEIKGFTDVHHEEDTDPGGTRSINLNDLQEDGETNILQTIMPCNAERLTPVDPSQLLAEQCRAYDIVDWHLRETLAGKNPPQLLMVIPGEGGVGKSKTIQTITENFAAQGMKD